MDRISKDEILQIDVHDAPVKKIILNIEEKSIILLLEIWDENISDYQDLLIRFEELTLFSVSDFSIKGFSVEDIVSIEILEKEPNGYEIELIFGLGFGNPVWKVCFYCKDFYGERSKSNNKHPSLK